MMQQRHMLTSHAFEEEKAEVEKIAYDTLKRIQ